MRRLPAALLVAVLALAALADVAGAQVRPRPRTPPQQPQPPRSADTIPARPGRDTIPGRTARDTARAGADTARIKWVEEDSVTRALLNRPGYTVTRYQGPILTFDALTRAIDLFIGQGDSTRVAVQRDNRLIVADTSISYSEESGVARATGRVFVREGETELTGIGGEYDLRERSVTIRGGRTAVQTEENWFVAADVVKLVPADSTSTNRYNSFARYGSLTSCDDTTHGGLPHYHFAFKELKRTAGNTMVARPAVLYISDIPVMWLPFVFQDMRPGRRSGMLTPRIGFTDFIRNSPSYRRNVENIGYYWAISDYMDLEASFDWLSNTGRDAQEAPGWTRYNADWRYNWLDRFLSGSLGASLTRQGNGSENMALSWYHNQEFTRDRKLRSNVNWVQSTTVQRQTNINPFAVLATISSSVNLSDRIGPASIQLGATRKQFSGREEVEQTLPTLSITTGTLNLTPWLAWTPNFQVSEQRRMNVTQPSQLGAFFDLDRGGRPDTVSQDVRTTTASFDTPIEIFGFNLRNSFRFNDYEVDFPQLLPVVNPEPGQPPTDRVFARTYRTSLDWTPSFALPTFAQGTWKVSPSVSLQNVYGQAAYMERSQLTGGRWLTQSKRPTFGLSIAPTFYGLLPGFGSFSRFRHAISTQFSYQYAPSAGVSDEFLLGLNQNPRDYIGAIPMNQFTFGFGTNLEGKGRPAAGDTTATAESAAKVNIAAFTFSPLSYDVSRYRKTGRAIRGLTTNNFSASVDSDLLPGVDLSLDWSLFSGDNFNSDTAVFSPYLERVSGGFTLNARRNPLVLLYRLFGRAVPANQVAEAEIVEPLDDAAARAASTLPVAGSRARQPQMVVAPKEGWEATVRFTSSRQRPPRGGNIVEYDPAILCEPLLAVNRIGYDNCVAQARLQPSTEAPITSPQAGGAFYRVPPTTSISTALRFNLTPRWSGSWNTSYDVERGEFATHVVSLQRDLHDWRANFNFTQSPTGSFAFTFFISLKAEPDLKFDYNRSTYRQEVQGR